MVSRYLIVVNPMTNRQRRKKLNDLLKALEERCYQYEVFHTLASWQLNQEYFRQHLSLYTDVIALGGDGTINLVLNGIIDLDVRLGVIPCGTGNDFVRNIYKNGDNPIDTVLGDHEKVIDAGKCNERYFLNVLGVGYDGALVEAINKTPPGRFRGLVYIWHALKQLPAYQEKMTELKSEQNKNQDCFVVAFGNGRYFGNGMKITPEARLNDGLLDCCWVGKTGLVNKCYYLLRIFAGKHLNAPIVDYWQGKRFQVTTPGLPIEGDGESFGHTPADIRVIKNAVRIKIPEV